ncbi:jg27573 [Pararge aegeria aegeria]|uniref:Jg27573 protein n=1 Tax=Pararge aegeria aegeria TaxID=348720 RepID=A0A8S4SM73_9NEOP|nr:jg27573 [Pararge aegeria aegeria]
MPTSSSERCGSVLVVPFRYLYLNGTTSKGSIQRNIYPLPQRSLDDKAIVLIVLVEDRSSTRTISTIALLARLNEAPVWLSLLCYGYADREIVSAVELEN